jgi:Ser/Thr protein kinase RdoA (MazF antagonist)
MMSATVKAHGMDGNLVEPDWPPLTLGELRCLFENYPDLPEPTDVPFVSPRPLSAAGIVNTSTGRVFVKRHHRTVRDKEGLSEEHRFMAYLLAAGAGVPRVYLTNAGQSAIEIGEWTYEVHGIPRGVDLYGDAISWTPFRTPAHAFAAGRALARLHVAAQGYQAAPRKPQPLVASFSIFAAADPAIAMEQFLAARPSLATNAAVRVCCRQALQLLAPYHAQLRPLLRAFQPFWTHNDLHSSNLLWSDSSEHAQATAIIDFGLADRTNAVHDLANAIERNIVEWLQLVADPEHPDDVAVHFDHLEAMLDGYDSIRPLAAEEAAALAPMTALCHAEFALSEADYFLGVLRSPEKAVMAYDGWLVGHARWFRSEAGKNLLNAIEAWARNRVSHSKIVGAK